MTRSGDLVVVTGGAGYVGSMVASELLSSGTSVRVLDSFAVGDGRSLEGLRRHPSFEFIEGDVRDPDVRLRALASASAVVHLAAIVGDPACARAPLVARDVNYGATRALLADAEAAGCARFVFASTCSNYGKMASQNGLVTEEWELKPLSIYAETKVAAELDVLSASSADFATTCLRLATVYGVSPRMRFDLTVNEFTRDALLTGSLVIYGEQFWRPYIHVRDAARAVAAVLQAPRERVAGQVFNAGDTGQNFRKQDLVEMLLARLPATTIERVPLADDPRDYRVAFDKIRTRLDFSITKRVDEGIDEVLELLRSGAVEDPYSDDFRN